MITTGSVKVLRLAGRTIAAPPGFHGFRRHAAIRTEAMPRMPADQRLGFGQRRQMIGADQTLHRNGAQVGDFYVIAHLQPLDRLRVEAETEARGAVEQPEEHVLAHSTEPARVAGRKQRIAVSTARL
jgi:hypothetical protein